MSKIDEIDMNILNILQEDSRTPYRKITRKLGISIGTVHNRVNKLKKNEIINGFTIKVNNSNLGYKLTFLINISIVNKHTSEILEELSRKIEVCSIFHTTGKDSAVLVCRFKDMEEVQKFISELNQNESIFNTESNMILKEYKNNPFIELGV